MLIMKNIIGAVIALLATAAVSTTVGAPPRTKPTSSGWHSLDISATCNADIISTAEHVAKDQFTFNGGRLASASWQRRNRRPEAGIPDDGRVEIPTSAPSGYFQVRMPPAKSAILLSGTKGVQPKPISIELADGESRRYSELAILQSSCWGHATLRIRLRYEDGTKTTASMAVSDWSAKGRSGPLPKNVRIAALLHGIHPRFGAPVEMHAHQISIDPQRSLRSLSFEVESIRPLKGVGEPIAQQRFTSAIFAISARQVSTANPPELSMSVARGFPAESASTAKPAASKLAFNQDRLGNLVFNTGIVKGSLRKDGKANFFRPISLIEPGVPMDNNQGLFVPYRFLTSQKRYGFGSWEWPRTGRILPNGAAELVWIEAPSHPFKFAATYTWTAADTLDFKVEFTPSVDLEKFELFIGSYFKQFNKTVVYVRDAGDGSPGFVDTPKEKGKAQLFPRDEDVMPIIRDGRWKFPPYPNNWEFRQMLQAPLGVKSQPKSGATVVIMAPPEDCFAVSMFEQNAPLGSYYLSLFGRDVKKGQTLVGHARMVFGKDITNEEAMRKYQNYLESFGN